MWGGASCSGPHIIIKMGRPQRDAPTAILGNYRVETLHTPTTQTPGSFGNRRGSIARKETWLFKRGEILLLAGRRMKAHEAFASALAALESLPIHRRRTRAVADLEGRLRAALASDSTRY